MDTAPTEIYTLSLPDALPICREERERERRPVREVRAHDHDRALRSEEHTSELQSRENLVCRLLLEKKKKTRHTISNEKRKPKPQNTSMSAHAQSLAPQHSHSR